MVLLAALFRTALVAGCAGCWLRLHLFCLAACSLSVVLVCCAGTVLLVALPSLCVDRFGIGLLSRCRRGLGRAYAQAFGLGPSHQLLRSIVCSPAFRSAAWPVQVPQVGCYC